jgi:hypothetical protein
MAEISVATEIAGILDLASDKERKAVLDNGGEGVWIGDYERGSRRVGVDGVWGGADRERAGGDGVVGWAGGFAV